MLTKVLEQAITQLRDSSTKVMSTKLQLRLADLLLVCAAQGDVAQTVAESVARQIVSEDEVLELRDA